jgi:hypothetical protein
MTEQTKPDVNDPTTRPSTSTAAIVGFIATLFIVMGIVSFAIFDGRVNPGKILQQSGTLYYTLGAVLLLSTLVSDLVLLIKTDDATWQVRLAAMDVVFVLGLLVITIAIIRQNSHLANIVKAPQLLIAISWLFMLINLICNMVIFFTAKCY